MTNPLLEAKAIRERAEAAERAGRWQDAASAYEALAKAWLVAGGLALTPTERNRRIDYSNMARAKSDECKKKAAHSAVPSPKRNEDSKNLKKSDGLDGDDDGVGQPQSEGDGPPESEFLVADKPTETLDDIMGMADAKREVEDFLDIVSDPEGAKKFNLRASSGLLLYGPPGNGKTMFGKAIANRVDAPFYYASGAAIRSKWVGESSQRLHALFQYARKNPVAVIFFDEIETLIPKRKENTNDVDKQIVTQFLQEVGGFTNGDSKIFLLGATNCPWDIDDAAFRTGRFDLKLFIGAPDKEARLAMLRRAFNGVELASEINLEKWAMRLDLYTGSDISGLAENARRAAYRRYRSNHSDSMVQESDLENALKLVTRSITPELLKKFEDFAKSRS